MNAIYNESDEFATLLLMTFLVIGAFIKFIVGMIVNIIVKNDSYVGKANITIWGNMIIIMSILCIVALKHETDKKLIAPVILFIISLLWETSYTYKYYDRINNTQVPDTYYIWGNWSFIFMFTIIIILILYLRKDDTLINDNTYNMLYIIIFFNLILNYIQQLILDSYMVDKKIEYE